MLLLAAASACGGEPPRHAEPHQLGPLALLIPEGATTIVLARPSSLSVMPPARRVIDTVAPRDFVEAWAIRTGVDPYRIEEGVVAEYEHGFIVIVRGPFDAPLVVHEAGARMTGVENSQERPFVRRIGWLGTDHRELVALAPNVVMVADGEPTAIAACLARAQGRATTPAALAGRDIAPLYRQNERAPLVILAPERLELPPGLATSVLLAQERGLSATITPQGANALRVEVELRGDFPPGAAENFRALVESVAGSTLGGALGLRDALPTLRIQADEGGVVLRMTISAMVIAMGLRVLFYAEIRDLFTEPAAAPNNAETLDNPVQ